MQDLSNRHSLIVRMLSVFLALLFLLPMPVSAAEYPDYGENLDTLWIYAGGFLEWFWNVLLANATDVIWEGDDGYYLNSVLDASLMDCPYAIEMGINNGIHSFPAGSSNLLKRSCIYCGLGMADIVASLDESEDEYVSSMDSTTASSGLVVTGFSVSSISNGSSGSSGYIYSYSNEWKQCLYNAYYSSSAVVVGCYGKYMWGYYWLDDGQLYTGLWSNPLGTTNSAVLGVYSHSNLTLLNTYRPSLSGTPFVIYFNKSFAEKSTDFLTSSVYAFDWSTPNSSNTFSVYYKQSINSTWDASLTTTPVGFYGNIYMDYVSNSRSCFYPSSVDAVTWDNSRIIVQPSNTDDSSRMATFLEAISVWNEKNKIDTDVNAMLRNFLMGRVDTDGSVTDVYDPSLYDEETLIFTEPVTGAQYQTTGWTYDYTTRSYDMDLEAGTFLIGEADITRILLTYGDENVTIEYYDSTDTLIQTDEYAYVMASGSECGLNGHSYSVETTKDATCISTGERVYTCSVCGDQKVEDVPMKEHTSRYSVFKEPTCTSSGVAMYTCATCGNQYTETIEALGHDWLTTESLDTTYALPEGTSCPGCAGTDFTCELDEGAGIYSCTCNACGAAWTTSAEVTTGYTVYTCSTCGETKTESAGDVDNSLFASIGNLFADGITWCTEKLTQLVDSLNSIVDSFNEYLETVSAEAGVFPEFLTQIISLLPEDLMAVIWFAVIAFVLLAVWKKWLS